MKKDTSRWYLTIVGFIEKGAGLSVWASFVGLHFPYTTPPFPNPLSTWGFLCSDWGMCLAP